MKHSYTYAGALAASERIAWKIDDVAGPGTALDFGRPFLPEALARAEQLEFLDPRARLALNQIRANGYLAMFGLVEEFILPFVLDHARSGLGADATRDRALMHFAAEEAKHIDLFRRFAARFEDGFGTHCATIGPPAAIGAAVLAKDPLSVALLILHIEWMTQRHYLDSVRDAGGLDPQFKSLLRHHWMEECQHAKLDTLMVETLARSRDAAGIAAAVDGYLEIGAMFDAGLRQQVEFDLDALRRATGTMLAGARRDIAVAVQHQAQRHAFIGSGMTHPNFLATLGALSPGARARIESAAPAFC